MKHIKDLLHNNKKAYIHITEIQSVCAEIITKIIHVQIPPAKVQRKNTSLIVKVPPVVKAEIHMQREKILKEINQQGITITAIN